jgi:hypothetical protein
MEFIYVYLLGFLPFAISMKYDISNQNAVELIFRILVVQLITKGLKVDYVELEKYQQFKIEVFSSNIC